MRTHLNFDKAVALVPLLALAVLAGCGESGDEGDSGPTVVATTTQAADLAENVGGERAEVVSLLSANSDPHEFEPQPSDAEALTEAALIVESGGDLDVWIDELTESSGTDAAELVLLDHVRHLENGHLEEAHAHEHESEEAEADEHAHEEGEVDPHWWQNPANAMLATEAIRDALVEADPEGRVEYQRNAASYVKELQRLDVDIRECVATVPPDERNIVTTHDALGYFTDRYGITVVGSAIPALTTQAQPSAGELADLAELIREEQVGAIFPEAGLSSELETTLADETGAPVGPELYADALAESGPASTYVGAMRANAAAIVGALGGDPRRCDGR